MQPGLRAVLFGSATPYRGASLVLDFVGGAKTRRKPYYALNGRKYAKVSDIPGWTYTGGTPAGTGSYAPKADGSLQFFPSYTNLLTYSEQFDNAAWTKFAAPITADAIAAPTGTTTADKMTPTAASSLHYMVQSITNSTGQFTSSVYAKSAGYTKFRLNMTDNATGSVYGSVDLTAGTVAMTSDGTWTGGSASIQALSNGWYRVTVTGTRVSGTSTALRIDAQDASGNLSFTGDGTSGIYVWGAQLELGSTASTYIPTTTAAVTVAPPRITDAGYLAEEARTNLLLRSQEFDNATSWPTLNTTVTANAVAAPDGTTTADKLTSNTASVVEKRVLQTISGNVTTQYVLSAYMKAAELSVAVLSLRNAAGTIGIQASADLSAGTVTANSYGSPSAPITPTIQALNNGWYRVTVGGVLNSGGGAESVLSGVFVSTGTAVGSGVYIWQADLQAGSFATSPIPTTSVAVTRAADVGYISGLTVPSAYSVMAQATTSSQASGFPQMFSIDNGTTSNDAQIYFNAASVQKLFGYIRNGGVDQAFMDLGSASNLTLYSAAMRVAANDFAATKSGATPTTDASGSVPTTTIARVGAGPFSNNWNAPIRRIVIYPRAMSNAELQAITLPTAA